MPYVHGHHDAVLRSHRWRTIANSAAYLTDDLVRGARVLDVGCGPGTITAEIALAVAPGAVIAVDSESSAVAETSQHAAMSGATNVTSVVADVMELPISLTGFDVIHAHQVLQHVTDPVEALRHMRSRCAPGGVVAARDADYAAMFWYPRLPEIDEWHALYQRVAREAGGEPDAARRLPEWASRAGFGSVDYTVSTWVFREEDDRRWWGGMWADRVRHSRIADGAIALGIATRSDLERIAEGWKSWADDSDAVFVVPHGEVRCRD